MEAFLANLPFALLFLLCPLMMLFMHRGGAHDAHGADHAQHHIDDRAGLVRKVEARRDEIKS